MKKLLLLAGIGLMTLPVFSQDANEKKEMRSLLANDGPIHHGGWGAPFMSYSRVLDQDAVFIGVKGGWLINHRLTIGVAGSGLVSSIRNAAYDEYLASDSIYTDGSSKFRTGYGGLLIEPVLFYRSPVHISLPILIGAGGVSYSVRHDYDSNEDEWQFRPRKYFNNTSGYFVLEPGIELELNVIPLLRVSLGASYRYTSDLDLEATPDDALHGFSGSLSIKVGSF